jgi:hypothetical protein
VVPALLVSLGSALGGYLFGDSLQARTNAQVRAEVLKSYFSVENRNIGKRKQILAFVGSNLAKNDPNLLDWVKRETRIVDEELVRVDREIADLKVQIATERAKASKNAAQKVAAKTSSPTLEGRLEDMQGTTVELITSPTGSAWRQIGGRFASNPDSGTAWYLPPTPTLEERLDDMQRFRAEARGDLLIGNDWPPVGWTFASNPDAGATWYLPPTPTQE